MDRPIVLCGLGRMGWRVLDYLRSEGMPVVVVDTVCKPDDPRLCGTKLVQGDCRRRDVLDQVDVANARGVLILTADDLLNITTALLVRSLNRDVRIVLRMFNQNLLARLGKAVHNVYALSTSLLTAPILAMTAATGQSLGTFRLDESAEGLRQLVEVSVARSPLLGQTVAAIVSHREVSIVAHQRAGVERFLLDVPSEQVVAVGDRVIVYGEPKALAPLLVTEDDEEDERRYGWTIKRLGRIVWRTIREMDPAVMICSAVLIAVCAISTTVFTLGIKSYDVPKALLRTVSIIATGANLGDQDFQGAPRIQVFVSVLRIVGAVLMAAFTAICTNYLLRARLGGLLDVRRTPEGGHVIVCGLSSVGFRVVEELIRLGERVVVVEMDPANRFVPTARRLGAVVLIGDAGVIEVLRQAHAGDAKAVVPATDNDMTNLEVALLVRETLAEQRVVLLLNDPQFAEMLREAAGVRLAVSVPALAAPAFIAGLFGDRVVSVFLMHERLFAVIDLVINDQDPLIGRSIRAVSVDYRMQPLAMERNAGPKPSNVLTGAFEAGDRVLTIIALTDLNRLLQRAPSSGAYKVEVVAFPLPTREWLLGEIRKARKLNAEEAEAALQQLPVCLGENLTKGEADEMMQRLTRERVTANVSRAGE